MLAIIDYGAGNMRSVERAVRHVGAEYEITIDPAVIAAADGVVLPGVGAARDTMTGLLSRDLTDPVRQAIASDRPFLGVCMGLQALFTGSEEDGGTDCLDLYPGAIRRFPDGLHIPHMGWNQVTPRNDVPILEGIAPGTNFYFVHSYYAGPPDADFCGATTEYGVPFLSVLHDGNVFGTQFHPEKSGRPGLRIYANFARLCGESIDLATI
ncbi:MAG TPA: imidazole glycerol phosphate synthase subunit HisH [Chloroflexota bacterium]|nr:imidazole glycerol phosphate synthase subunit HisH [Chloroflexota bacterium]